MEGVPSFTELYDYQADPLETCSLADAPDQAERLANFERRLQQKIKEIARCKVNTL
jgi:hypothetical protein